MSWNLNIPATPRAEFDAAVDAAVVNGQDPETVSGLREIVTEARVYLKALAASITREQISGTAHGHCLEEGQGTGWYEGTAVSVSGTEKL